MTDITTNGCQIVKDDIISLAELSRYNGKSEEENAKVVAAILAIGGYYSNHKTLTLTYKGDE